MQEIEGCQKTLIGITDYAQKSLGDIVYVELPEIGKELAVNDTIGVVESVKGASDIYSPVKGRVVEVNEALQKKPGIINKSPQKDGWICKVEFDQEENKNDHFLTEQKYHEFCDGGH